MKSKLILAASCMILLAPGFSIAGSETDYDYTPFLHSMEVYGSIGVSNWDTSQNATILGGGVVFRPYPKAGFEVGYKHFGLTEEYRNDPYYDKFERDGTIVTGSVHYYFLQQRVQPYVLLGGGYMGVKTKSLYREPGYEQSREYTDSSVMLEVGTGVDIFLTTHLSLRPDARVLVGPDGLVQGSINVCYHW